MAIKKQIRNWELAGAIFIFFIGPPWHYLFEWTGYWRPIAWLVPINESFWEHLKLAFWPGVLWALVGYWVIGKKVQNYWLGKALGLVCMLAAITVIFYSYTAILGTHQLWIDILAFLLAVALGQFVSARFLMTAAGGRRLQWLGVVLLAGMMLASVVFTYAPPHLSIFEDPEARAYGILSNYEP